MFRGVIQKITLAQFFETRCIRSARALTVIRRRYFVKYRTLH